MSLYTPDDAIALNKNKGYNHFLAITTNDVTKIMIGTKNFMNWSSFSITNITELVPKLDYWKRAYITTEEFYKKEQKLFEELKDFDKNVLVFNKDNKVIRELSLITRNTNRWYKWKRRVKKGEPYYECSSKGDKRYSPFYATVKGKTIEEWYQIDLKGYKSIKDGKGKPPKKKISEDDLYYEYLKLWSLYFLENKELLEELKEKALNKTITDMFATSKINQARALCDICNYGLFK